MVTAFIPARGGSKGIPLKNIKPFCGRPLIYWCMKALEDAPSVEKVVVATDSDAIEETVSSFGFKKACVYRRKSENATDTAATESVMLEYLEVAPVDDGEVFMLVQATSPLTTTDDIEKGLEMMRSGRWDSVLSCVRNYRFFWSAEGESLNYDWKNRPRRQDFDGNLMENGAFYINTAGGVRKYGNRIGGRIGICEMPSHTAFEIDEADDWTIMEALMYRHLSQSHPGKLPVLFLSDVDGTLTDGGMYYGPDGEVLKKFNTRDGMGFQLLREKGIKTGFVTSENNPAVTSRGKKLKVDHIILGCSFGGKVEAVREICRKEGINLSDVAYIGDDINCLELLREAGFAACPADADPLVKNLPFIYISPLKGGEGCVRDFIRKILGV